jgi:hypothetical protein
MRAEVAELEPVVGLRGRREPIVRVGRRTRRIDRFDLWVLVVFACISLWVIGLDLWQVIVKGRDWTGTDGVYIVDQMQYLAWIRDASQHLLASNLFVLRSTPADYFQPAIAISGGISALGVSPEVTLLLWKPAAVAAAFFGIRRYVRRSISGLWPRRAALVLALFFGSFTVVYGSFGVLGDLFPGFLSWGYVFALIGLAAMVYALLYYDRAWREHRISWTACTLGALATMLHPWNGEVLITVVVLAELILRLRRGRWLADLALPTATVAATALPLVYYAALGKLDLSWELARDASKHTFSLWSVLLVIVPLAIPAALAYRRRPETLLAAATRAWPIAAVLIYVVSGSAFGATPLHAFQGITIPLAVLAVEGVNQARSLRRVTRRRLAATVAVALATIPATVYELYGAGKLAAPTPGNANFIVADEHRALHYLADEKTPGGVLTRSYLGAVVPGTTGRHTLVGDCLWSEPLCYDRVNAAQDLFDGSLSPSAAQRFVLRTRARFVLADCSSSADLTQLLWPIITSVHQFGCAAVYEVV